MKSSIKIGLIDDHSLLRKGMVELIENYEGYEVLFEAGNGKELMDVLGRTTELPSMLIMDVNMPVMNGFEAMEWLKDTYPDLPVLALSMYDDDHSIVKMMSLGAKGYILKDAEPDEFKEAMDALVDKGFYYSRRVGKLLLEKVQGGQSSAADINDREKEFLSWACTELTYKEIADKMFVSPRTIDGYRESLFVKLEVKNRVGLAMYAIKSGIYKIK